MLVSDYGYGAATPRLLTFVKSNGCLENKPITVDSRYRILDYEGATAATPNEPEVEEALHLRIGHDDEKLFAAASRLMQGDAVGVADHHARARRHGGVRERCRAGDDSDLRLRSGGGCNRRRRYGHRHFLATALAAGADTVSAARLANFAGGIVVMKRGTATVTGKELLGAIDSYPATSA